MSRPDGVPASIFRAATITVARQTLAEAERIEYATVNISVLARHVGGLTQVVRDLLEVLEPAKGKDVSPDRHPTNPRTEGPSQDAGTDRGSGSSGTRNATPGWDAEDGGRGASER